MLANLRKEKSKLEFWSILFLSEEREKSLKFEEGDYIKDLNLDALADVIFGREENLKKLFFTPLKDELDVKYRLDFLKDLEIAYVYENLKSLHEGLESSLRKLKLSEKLSFRIHKWLWFLEAAYEYTSYINSFVDKVEKGERGFSEAFILFFEHLKSISSEKIFKDMAKDAKELKETITNYKFLLKTRNSKIEILEYEDKTSLLFLAKDVFSFLEYKGEDIDLPDLFTPTGTSRLEAAIVENALKFRPELLKNLEEFSREYKGFFDEKLVKFVEEFYFYRRLWVFFHETLKGLPFCMPEIVSESQDKEFEDFYNPYLAYKLLGSDRSVVTNNLEMHRDERIFVVTGPNQGGKTTFVKAVGQILHFLRIGSYVAASKTKGWIVSGIFTHFEKEENVKEDKSGLEREILNIKEILNKIDERSMVIMNESFSSTSVKDALYMSKKVMDLIKRKQAFCLYVTFFYEIAEFDGAVSLVAEVDKLKGERTFRIERKPIEGRAFTLPILKKYKLTYEDIIGSGKDDESVMG